MKFIDKFVITLEYHPLQNKEEQFLKAWNDTIYKIASGMGGRMITICHKKNTDTYVASAHFSSVELAKKFLTSNELRHATDNLNQISSNPAICNLLEILDERAA